MLVGGFFNTSESLFGASALDISTFAITGYFTGTYHALKSLQLLILALFYTATLYVATVNLASSRTGFTASIALALPIAMLQLNGVLHTVLALL